MNTKPFLDYIAERQAIYSRREAGGPFPWTVDPVLATRKFCCVIRDNDWTSKTARRIILEQSQERRLGLTLTFRLYNRPMTLSSLVEANRWTRDEILTLLSSLDMVFNTQAYRVTVKGGLWNLPTISGMIASAVRLQNGWEPRDRAQYTVEMIQGLLNIGPFIAYQIMQDLRWLGYQFKDEDEWCLIGGGARKGLLRLTGDYRPEDQEKDKKKRMHNQTTTDADSRMMLPMMGLILRESKEIIPSLNMFEIEHNLCEFDKLERIRSGETSGLRWKPRDDGVLNDHY